MGTADEPWPPPFDWRGVPLECRSHHIWGPGLVDVSWLDCTWCGGAGHWVVRCGVRTCTEEWTRPKHDPRNMFLRMVTEDLPHRQR